MPTTAITITSENAGTVKQQGIVHQLFVYVDIDLYKTVWANVEPHLDRVVGFVYRFNSPDECPLGRQALCIKFDFIRLHISPHRLANWISTVRMPSTAWSQS